MSIPLRQRVAGEVRAEMAWQQRTVAELAETLGVGYKSAKSRYDGKQEITLDEVDTITSWLGVSKSQLLAGRHDERAAS